MRRFFGMMPSNEIDIEKTYEDSLGLKITIQAGEKGWSIIFADGSSKYKNIENTAEENFNEAKKVLTSIFGFENVKEVSGGIKYDVLEK